MDNLDALPPRNDSNGNTLSWKEVTPSLGVNTQKLFDENPNLQKLKSIRILEYISPYSDKGLVLLPGGLDTRTDDEAIAIGHKRQMSVFHIKYPDDSSFSIRGEVAQMIDELTEKGIKSVKVATGSWGGIPSLNLLYELQKSGKIKVDSFFAIAPAFQPSDFTKRFRSSAGNLGRIASEIKSNFPLRQKMVRTSASVPDFEYDPEIIAKLAEIPTVIIVPPGGQDWLIDAQRSMATYFPNASVVECPAYVSPFEKVVTWGGHNTTYNKNSLAGIRQISENLIDNPEQKPPLPLPLPHGFNLIR